MKRMLVFLLLGFSLVGLGFSQGVTRLSAGVRNQTYSVGYTVVLPTGANPGDYETVLMMAPDEDGLDMVFKPVANPVAGNIGSTYVVGVNSCQYRGTSADFDGMAPDYTRFRVDLVRKSDGRRWSSPEKSLEWYQGNNPFPPPPPPEPVWVPVTVQQGSVFIQLVSAARVSSPTTGSPEIRIKVYVKASNVNATLVQPIRAAFQMNSSAPTATGNRLVTLQAGPIVFRNFTPILETNFPIGEIIPPSNPPPGEGPEWTGDDFLVGDIVFAAGADIPLVSKLDSLRVAVNNSAPAIVPLTNMKLKAGIDPAPEGLTPQMFLHNRQVLSIQSARVMYSGDTRYLELYVMLLPKVSGVTYTPSANPFTLEYWVVNTRNNERQKITVGSPAIVWEDGKPAMSTRTPNAGSWLVGTCRIPIDSQLTFQKVENLTVRYNGQVTAVAGYKLWVIP